MPFDLANQYAFSLASTLMAVIVIFQAADGSFTVVPETEFDGNETDIIRTIDPFAP